MESRQVTRRFVVTALGSGVALAPVIARSAASKFGSSMVAPHEAASDSGEAPESTPSGTGERLIAPLAVGSTIRGCTLVKVGALTHGAVGLSLTDASGRPFGIEICARDASSPRSPAETDRFQLYVVNEGDGSLPTVEEHGLAAMTIASFVRNNESEERAAGFLTLQERLARHAGELIRPE